MASHFSEQQFKRMQIHLIVFKSDFNEDLLKRINEVEDLNKYTSILPKSIIFDTRGTYSTKFLKDLLEIFDKSITKFNYFNCEGSVKSSIFLSNFAKKVCIRFNEDEN